MSISEEKIAKEQKKEIKQIILLLKELKTTDIPILIEEIKKTFQLSEEQIKSEIEDTTKKEKTKTSESNVTVKIDGLKEGTTTALKLQAYKLIADIAKEFGNELNIIQAKKLVEDEGILANNLIISRAKEIKTDLEEKGVKILFIPVE